MCTVALWLLPFTQGHHFHAGYFIFQRDCRSHAGDQHGLTVNLSWMNLGSVCPLLESAALPKSLSERRQKLANV